MAKKTKKTKRTTGSNEKRRPKGRKRERAGRGSTGEWPLLPQPGEMIVRMYRQGLGDCFLLAVGTADPQSPRYVLIDCGLHNREDKAPARLLQVMRDIVGATGGRLDVVVATHEHSDHLSGFVQKDSPFLDGKLKIGKVWLAWTEKRGDGQADELRRKRGAALKTIRKALEELIRKPALKQDRERAEQIQEWLSFMAPIDGSVESATGPGDLGAVAAKRSEKASFNEVALELLETKGKPKYCEPGEVLTLPDIKESFRAYVLGPPRDEKLLKKDLPTKIRGANKNGEYKEVYLSGAGGERAFQFSPRLDLSFDGTDSSVPSDDMRYPFTTTYRRKYTSGASDELRWDPGDKPPAETTDFFKSTYLPSSSKWRRIDNDWLSIAETLALNLDSDTNNTSLVLAFELGEPGEGPVLLFTADAQVGNWLSWRRRSYGPPGRRFSIDDLLERTILYKVGHHGSHNATLQRDSLDSTPDAPYGVPYGLELMRDIVAMLPVDRAAADKHMPNPWKMPHHPLYVRLREKADRRVLRADKSLAPLDAGHNKPDVVPPSIDWSDVPGLTGLSWRKSEAQFAEGTPGPLYYDVRILIPSNDARPKRERA